MSTALDDMFMAETMTDQVRDFAEQSEERSFLEPYEAGGRITPTTHEFVYDQVKFSRGMSPVMGPSAPTEEQALLGVEKLAGNVYKIGEHRDLPADLVHMARSPGSMGPDPQRWLDDNLLDMTNRIQRTRNYWAFLSLHQASVALGSFPNAKITGVTLTYPVATLAAMAAWSNAATKIRSSEVNRIVKTYRQTRGYNPGVAIANEVVEGYITQNTELSNPVDHVPTLAQRKIESSYIDGGSLMRVGSIDYKFAKDYYTTEADPATPVELAVNADKFCVLPPRSRWGQAFATVEGRAWIPTGSIAKAALGSAFSLMAEVRGFGAYLELIMNPIGLRLHAFWIGSLVQKEEGAVLVFDPTP